MSLTTSSRPIPARALRRRAPTGTRAVGAALAPGVFPVKQQRSEQTRERLLRAGRALLQDGHFDEISISQIAAHAGCAVGSFYLRFRNKEAYFEFLLGETVAELRERTLQSLTVQTVSGLGLAGTLHACIEHFVGISREQQGLVRAALQYSINGTSDWQPVRDIGMWLQQHYIGLILRGSRSRERERLAAQLRIGFHVISGHLVNLAVHPDGVLPMDHPRLVDWLSGIVTHCLRVRPYVSTRPERAVRRKRRN